MTTMQNLSWMCGALLAAVTLTLAAQAAEAFPAVNYDETQGNRRVAVRNVAACAASRSDTQDGASADAIQRLYTRLGGAPEKEAFHFIFSAYYNGPSGYAFTMPALGVNGEWELPFPDPAERPQELAYAGQRRFPHDLGVSGIAVGSSTYSLEARATVALDFAFEGRARSRADTELAGKLRTRMGLQFRMWLPLDIMIEYGQVVDRSGAEHLVQGPSAYFESCLSCDLNTHDANLTGSWSRMQQAPWALRLNLIRTTTFGGRTFTTVQPVMDQTFLAVDEYIFDRRP